MNACHVMSCHVIHQKRRKKEVSKIPKEKKNQIKIHILSEIKKKVTEKKEKRLKERTLK